MSCATLRVVPLGAATCSTKQYLPPGLSIRRISARASLWSRTEQSKRVPTTASAYPEGSPVLDTSASTSLSRSPSTPRDSSSAPALLRTSGFLSTPTIVSFLPLLASQ